MKKKQREAAKKSESRWRGSQRLDVARERVVGDRRTESQTDKGGGKGDTVFKWPNQGTSPSKGELVCVCVSMCVFGQGGWGGCTLTD